MPGGTPCYVIRREGERPLYLFGLAPGGKFSYTPNPSHALLFHTKKTAKSFAADISKNGSNVPHTAFVLSKEMSDFASREEIRLAEARIALLKEGKNPDEAEKTPEKKGKTKK